MTISTAQKNLRYKQNVRQKCMVCQDVNSKNAQHRGNVT
uniref:Uncharacterized protein n=1 Tax=Arundo donax TaxID=35708 RepID=A0A0A8YB80_ARUDO